MVEVIDSTRRKKNKSAMRPSIKQHIYKQFFGLTLLTVIALVSLVELISHDIEDNMFGQEIEMEKTHYLPLIGDTAQTWKTAATQVAYIPNSENNDTSTPLPAIFQGLTIPFSGEIELPDKEFWVDISRTPSGVLYISHDVTMFDQREEVFMYALFFVGLLFVVISFILSQLSTRRIIKPLTKLTEEISHIIPRQQSMRVTEDYLDQELYSIASTFNTYLETMEDYVKREQMLVGMASHELRTPIAIISGALDILDNRGLLQEKDKITVNRIRSAANEMNANVKAILLLARKQGAKLPTTHFLLSQSLEDVCKERYSTHPSDKTRLNIITDKLDHSMQTDITLVNMLLRNLIQNALEHTQGNVHLRQNDQGLLISDEGAGLPEDKRLQLSQKLSLPGKHAKESGLGLFIVTLICDRLGWTIRLNEENKTGTHIQLFFTDRTD